VTEINKLTKEELKDLYIKTIELREMVLAWEKECGYSASSLVSRTAEHDMEMYYGRLELNERNQL